MDKRSELPRDLAALLERVVVGDRSPQDPVVQAAVQQDPEFARQLDELTAVRAALDATGQDHARALAAPLTEADNRVVSAGLSAARRPALASYGWLAAALLIVALAGWFLIPVAPPRPVQPLGTPIAVVEPTPGMGLTIGTVVRWHSRPLLSDERFVVEVLPRDASVPQWRSAPLASGDLVLDQGMLAAWPARLRLRVLIVDRFGEPMAESAAVEFVR